MTRPRSATGPDPTADEWQAHGAIVAESDESSDAHTCALGILCDRDWYRLDQPAIAQLALEVAHDHIDPSGECGADPVDVAELADATARILAQCASRGVYCEACGDSGWTVDYDRPRRYAHALCTCEAAENTSDY